MNSPREKHIAFSISAGCYFYQLGIAYYIQKHFDLTGIKFTGASGGGWPALLLAAGIDVKEGFECVVKYAPECCQNRPILGAYMVYDQGISIVFNKLFSEINLAEIVNGRLGLSVTRLAWNGFLPFLKDEQVSIFNSNDDIRQCIIASALIPYALNGKPYVIYRGWICADGGITNVTGVRRFAEELVHDIEMIEEEIAEQAHQLSDQLLHPYHAAPMSAGPYGIVRFGATITDALVSMLVDSFHHLVEHRREAHQGTSPDCGKADPTPNLKDEDSGRWALLKKRIYDIVASSGSSSVGSDGAPVPCSIYQSAVDGVRGTLAKVGRVPQVKAMMAYVFDDEPLSMQALCSRHESWADCLLDGQHSSLAVAGEEEMELSCRGEEEEEEYGSRLDDDFPEPASSEQEMCLKDSGNSVVLSEGVGRPLLGADISVGYSTPSDKTTPHATLSTRFASPTTIIKRDNVIDDDKRVYWRVKGQTITKVPGGGMQLEVSPWMWRHHSVLNYHLSADPDHARKLFEIGIVDACEHHWELLRFFDPEEYSSMMRGG